MKKSIKNLKPFILGFLVCFLLMNFNNVKAAIKEYILQEASYPITLNGETYESDKLPPLVWEGNTYVPLKAMGDLLGAKVDWNNELKRVEITTVTASVDDSLLSKQVEAEAVKAQYPTIKNANDNSIDYTEYTKEGIVYRDYDNIKYISLKSVKPFFPKYLDIFYNKDSGIMSLKHLETSKVLLDNIPCMNEDFILYDYYSKYIDRFIRCSEFKEDGIIYIYYEGVKYISLRSVREVLTPKNIDVTYNQETKVMGFINYKTNKLLLTNVPHKNTEFIEYTYYLEHILPLVQ